MKMVILNLKVRIFELICLFVCIILSLYFLLATFKGEYGLFKKYQLIARESVLKLELLERKETKIILSNKVRRLSSSSLDLELLDEQIRKVLGMISKEELIIY